MTKFLLIGPTGIGKSTALKKLLKDNSIEIYDLDCLVKENVGAQSLSKYLKDFGDENFFNKSKDVIESIEREKNVQADTPRGINAFASAANRQQNRQKK
jgi:shikimate kinase